MARPQQRSASRFLPAALLALVAYVPLLLDEPGAVVADTKSYLYLDPSRLLSRAWSMWDPSIGTGTVTHQNIGYLWPMGPWYWAFDRLGIPDWVAQRVWLGTIIVLAGYGVVWLLRTLGWDGAAPWAGAFAYALTPYVLTVAARISVLLLPFAALPWLIALTIRALRAGGWRWPALFALVVTTVGSVNLTALALAGVGPVLWLLYALLTRDVTLRRAAAAVARMGVLTIPVSTWWLAGLWVQGGWGIDILKYTETAKVVAQASTANEVLRGLGYWFFYGGDKLGPWIEPSQTYTQKLLILAISYAIPIVALVGYALVRFRHRAFAALLVIAGVVLAVGAHPWDDPTIEGRGVEAFLQSDYGLSMRSLPRAVPLVALGLAIGLVALVQAIAMRWPRRAWWPVAAVMLIAVANMPPLWKLGMVPANLQRPESIPSYWQDAARWFDQHDDGTRVLELPGADFASYRWGNTIDPVLPGLMDRPYVARELIPYGSNPSANLLIALDHRLQERIIDPRAVAPIARLMSAGDISVRSDLQYERYNTPRPKNLWQILTHAPGLGAPVGFGPPTPNDVPAGGATLFDELYLQTPGSLPDPPPVAALPVDDPQAIVRGQRASAPLLLAGDGDGVVDLASAGMLSGDELVLYSGSDAGNADALRSRAVPGAVLVVTDSNRRRGQRWTTVRHNTGATTVAGQQPLATDLTDNELPVFGPAAGDDTKTVVVPLGGITANATSYGNPFTFTPEERPDNAIDGDPTTAWRAAAFSNAVGQRLELTLAAPTTTDHLTLLQPTTGQINRTITQVRVRFDDGPATTFALGDASNVAPGQRIAFPTRTFSKVSIEIAADTAGHPPRYGGLTSEGFAEVAIGDNTPHLDEVIRPPTDLLDALGSTSADHPLVFLFTRQRSTPDDPTRADEELSMIRQVNVPTARSFSVTGTARLSAAASDAVLDEVLGATTAITATTSPRLQGDRTATGAAVVDGDPTTAWTGRFDEGTLSSLDLRTPAPVTTDKLLLTVRADGVHSVPTSLDVVADGRDLGPVAVPAIADGHELNHTETVTVALPAAITASSWQLRVHTIREIDTTSWESDQPTAFPVSIAEVGIGSANPPSPLPPTFATACRSDLVTVDGQPVPVAISGTTADALAGNALSVQSCGAAPLALSAGSHVLRAAQGRTSGIDLDQLALTSARSGVAQSASGRLVDARTEGAPPTVSVTSNGRATITARVDGATPGQPFWLTLGQSYNTGWHATISGHDVGAPHLVDGYANGWQITPTATSFTVRMTFTPQQTVNKMLAVSVLAALVCIALAAWPRRRRWATTDAPAVAFASWRPVAVDASTVRRVLVTLVSAVVAFAFAGIEIGGVVGTLVAVAAFAPRARMLLRLASPAALALAALYVIAQQIRHHTAPGLEWPTELEAAHPFGWLAVLALAADLALERVSRARDRASA